MRITITLLALSLLCFGYEYNFAITIKSSIPKRCVPYEKPGKNLTSLQAFDADENEKVTTLVQIEANEAMEKIMNSSFQETQRNAPLDNAQRYIRDSGLLKVVVNFITRSALGPSFYIENPNMFPQFIRISEYPHFLASFTSQLMHRLFHLSNKNNDDVSRSPIENPISIISSSTQSKIHFEKVHYDHKDKKQMAQVMIKQELHNANESSPLFIFLHGGAWGSGFATMYRLISLPFLERNYRAIVLDYRTFPDGSMQDQSQDLLQAIRFFKQKYHTNDSSSPVVLCGHSSGAHIVMSTALKNNLQKEVDALICMSGVYDLLKARMRELDQGLQHISPMMPAILKSSGDWRDYSPVHILQEIKDVCLPPTLFLHGEDDPIVPHEYSVDFHQLLSTEYGFDCHLEVLKGVQHQDTVLETCIGKGRTQSIIFNWLSKAIK